MKVIDFLGLVSEYQRVAIYPCDEVEWNTDNPYILTGVKVRDLTWCFVNAVGNRAVVYVGSDTNENENEYNPTVLKIEYK